MAEDIKNIKNLQELIAREFGFSEFSEDNKKELIDKMAESVMKRVLVDAYEELSEVDRETFSGMIEDINNINVGNLDEFLEDKLSDYGELINGAMMNMKKVLADVK